MDTESKTSFSSVVSINPYTNEYVHGISSFLAPVTNAQYEKEQFVTSYLNTKSYDNTHIEISKNIPDEDIADAINTKIYEELSLDQAIEYKIQYIEIFSYTVNDNRHFQVFIVDPLEIIEAFQPILDTIKYIDVITPAPLLIKTLYTKEIIEDSGIDCFIYFEQNDSFITIYNETDFVYTKSLSFSLEEMCTRFSELYGEQIEYTDFIDFLINENLKYTSSEYKTFIFKLYKEIFSTINDILTYVKKAYDIEKINHLYVGSQVNMASKLYEIAEIELTLPASDFDFKYGFEESEVYIDPIHSLLHLATTLNVEEDHYACNFSTFNRPPKFVHRQSGKLIMLVAASIFVAFSYPISYWVFTYTQDLQYKLLQDSYQGLHTEKSTRLASVKTGEANKAKVLTLLKEEETNYISKKSTLIKIHDVKVNYPMKATLITSITGDLNKFSVKLASIQYSEENGEKILTFGLISSKDKKITQLLEYLTKERASIFKFTLDSIVYKENTNLYFSELQVKIL